VTRPWRPIVRRGSDVPTGRTCTVLFNNDISVSEFDHVIMLLTYIEAGLEFWAVRATTPTELFVGFFRKRREIIIP
jgi:hypothetical protein